MLIDTHTHLYLPEFDKDGGGTEAVKRAIDAGVCQMVMPNVDHTTVKPMLDLAAQFPDNISYAIGLHPTEVTPEWSDWQQWGLEHAHDPKCVAIGEIGIDLYWDKTYEREQMDAFASQVALAVDLDLPIIIHCREGLSQSLEVLQDFPSARGVFHSFGGTVEDVQAIRRIGDYYFGINGIVTFKNCHVRDSLAEIGLDRLLLETDAPYLAPVPHRGKRNESAFLINTAQHIAQHMGITYDQLGATTTLNAQSLFKLDLHPQS